MLEGQESAGSGWVPFARQTKHALQTSGLSFLCANHAPAQEGNFISPAPCHTVAMIPSLSQDDMSPCHEPYEKELLNLVLVTSCDSFLFYLPIQDTDCMISYLRLSDAGVFEVLKSTWLGEE